MKLLSHRANPFYMLALYRTSPFSLQMNPIWLRLVWNVSALDYKPKLPHMLTMQELKHAMHAFHIDSSDSRERRIYLENHFWAKMPLCSSFHLTKDRITNVSSSNRYLLFWSINLEISKCFPFYQTHWTVFHLSLFSLLEHSLSFK